MGKYFDVQVRTAEDDPSETILEVRVSLEGTETGQVLTTCRTLDQLSQLAEVLRREAELLVDQAGEALRELESRPRDEEMDLAPEEVWKQMEAAASEEDMFRYFNALSEDKRRQVAEYILTQVSMFKGRGPVFAEHYNIVEHTLDEEKLL
ncbi:hypothetical protein SAMN02746041_01670 [Desulfacinum hydrothermale DSM 13146]|uniref:Uncharacterized protein n=1 Tax=Desulfacinum hydrothermale DSM 13146 TaxID=1121390 RepID=A0A1W1XI17_9BACT|nr:hypothetical protein [Desulfacinum hydrothermale]SMC23148.1 hypothetical protein SAMN02746041_01670 [Desulfacinum hydrothermale DSM 13146]